MKNIKNCRHIVWPILVSLAMANALAGTEVTVRTPEAVCVDLVNIDLSSNSAIDRVASLGRFFSEDYPILYSEPFEKAMITALGGGRGQTADVFLRNFYGNAGPKMIQQLEDLKIDRVKHEWVLQNAGVNVWNKLKQDFLGGSASQVTAAYRVSPQDFLILQDSMRTIQSMPEMDAAGVSLVKEVIYQSIDNLITWAKLEKSHSHAYYNTRYVFAPLDPNFYCAFGRCVKRAATKKRIMRKAVDKIVNGGYIAPRGGLPMFDIQRTKVNFEELTVRLTRTPSAQALDSYAGVLDFDQEFHKAFHELELKGTTEHARFKAPATWAGFARGIENARAGSSAEMAAELVQIRNHSESFQRSLRLQLMAVAQSQQSLERMRQMIEQKLAQFAGDLTSDNQIYRQGLERLVARNESSMAESIIMAEGIQDWIVRTENFEAMLTNLGRQVNTLIASNAGVAELGKEFGKLRKQLGMDNP
jgi:hypothetical protein